MCSRYAYKIISLECKGLIVNTTYGLLRGREFKSRNGRLVAAFNGIPFATPPIGQLRFLDPQPPKPWTGIRDAYNFGSVCVQIPYIYVSVSTTDIGNEDCLYMSVYTPSVKPRNLLPVLVYFHGGGYFFGSGEIDKSPEFFMDYDIVVVMPNYRLGVLGFLTMEDNVMSGNMGLKDQNLALVWVQHNIANFGGDPGQVTLIGESAGGANVHYHMMSPMSRGLFHGCISQSGTALDGWANTPPGIARSRAIKMAQLFNCSTESSHAILDCLRTKNAFELTQSFKQFLIFQADPYISFVPIIDKNASNPFLPFNPHKAEPAPVPWIIGVCSLEGLPRTGVFIQSPEALSEYAENFNQIAPISLLYDNTAQNPDEITKKIREFYFGDQPISNFLISNLTNIYTDGGFVWPSVKSLQNHKGPHYLYYFDYLGENSFQEIYAGERIFKGGVHLEDTIYLWKNNNPFEVEAPTSAQDLNLSKLLVRLIYNFASLGEPTPPGSDFIWPLWDNEQRNYISFENRGVVQYSNLLPDRMQFWSELNYRDKVDGQE